MSSKVKVIACDASLSDEILECMSQLVGNKERLSLCPFIADAAACIEGEAELMINWLTWRDPPSKEFVLSRSIRRCALELAKIEGLEWSSDTAAFLLGIKKEARWLCENMMCDGFDSGFSTMIRGCAFELLSWKQDEYTSDGDVDVAVDMDIPILADHKAG
ncbi:hypothetical protein PVAP13_9KG340864 [Panicum virgatum]|nr:hypothetical protein PVAP13_9KG340864 [Panicum virgatum]